ncbi:phenylethanolamine N-methyltransferase-like [Liolophura sinensis]|uniref:phenylethanolamine N-methyltransferase-like n=1 Tax=Liolophura sinensis TaxID=3198878 RepID=UPI003158454D
MENPKYTADYSKFDPEAYCSTNFRTIEGPVGQKQMRLFIFDSLQEIYNSGEISGEMLLDVGTGPTVYNLTSAAPHFSNIYLSDFSEVNRNAVWRWLINDPQANDSSHFFEYVSGRQKKGTASSCLEDDLRSRIKGILHCDMTQPNPLFPSMFPPFDAISSSLCLDVVPSGTLVGYQAAAKNVTSLLRPGGWVVLVGSLGCNFYRFGNCRYPAIPMTSSNLKQIWTDIGFTIKVWKQYDMTEADMAVNQTSDSKGMFCMAAKKEN